MRAVVKRQVAHLFDRNAALSRSPEFIDRRDDTFARLHAGDIALAVHCRHAFIGRGPSDLLPADSLDGTGDAVAKLHAHVAERNVDRLFGGNSRIPSGIAVGVRIAGFSAGHGDTNRQHDRQKSNAGQ